MTMLAKVVTELKIVSGLLGQLPDEENKFACTV